MSQFAFAQPRQGPTALREWAQARLVVVGLLLAFGGVTAAKAQSTTPAFEIRPFVGAYIPTGDQRDALKDAVLVGGQLSWYARTTTALSYERSWLVGVPLSTR